MTVAPSVPTEDLPQKGFDPLVTRQILGFLSPYKLALFGSLLLMAVASAGLGLLSRPDHGLGGPIHYL
jgi:hypothetical protein